MSHLIVIAGPTASGKTAMAIELALQFDCGILSFDSRQCYQEMNIGTAAPTAEEQQGVPHYFIHSHSIHHPVTAGDYEAYGMAVLQEQFEKKPVMIAVGGTGLYLKALVEGLDDMPEIPSGIVEKLNDEYATNGINWLKEKASLIDPIFYEQGEINNPHRLLRALSFKIHTGKSILQFRQKVKKTRAFQTHLFGLSVERSLLYNRINTRVDKMMERGLLDEVAHLIKFQDLKPLRTVGYTELFEYLRGSCSLDEAVGNIKQHTRNYAKRQITWFNKTPGLIWKDSDEIDVYCHNNLKKFRVR